jgi:hypothetical protein
MGGYRLLKSNFSDTQDMNADWPRTNVEKLYPFFRGGEEYGGILEVNDLSNILADALKIILYQKVHPNNISRKPDRNYVDNASFWSDALSSQHFPCTYVVLDDFHLLEWLPFSPGRYFTREAEDQRKIAAKAISRTRNEYLPGGKCSMVRGGIGTVRLAEKTIGGQKICFLGASSTGIAHQGIPIALPSEEYRKVMPIIRDRGGCKVKLVGSLQTMTENFPSLDFDEVIPRYCLFAEEVTVKKPSIYNELLTTVAIMFTATEGERHYGDINKSWTFCSFHPGSSKGDERRRAVDWLLDYARRYSHDHPTVLTDFDEHYSFPCRVEFPISDIVRGTVDWGTLHVYKQRYQGKYIERNFNNIEKYIKQEIMTVNNQGDVYNVGQAAAVGRYARSDNNTFIQSEQKQTLAEAAKEIQSLLKQLEQT